MQQLKHYCTQLGACAETARGTIDCGDAGIDLVPLKLSRLLLEQLRFTCRTTQVRSLQS